MVTTSVSAVPSGTRSSEKGVPLWRHLMIVYFWSTALGWFGFFYALTYYEEWQGYGASTCVNGIHFHHLYVGIIIALVSGIYLLITTRWLSWETTTVRFGLFILGIGTGLILDDVFDHFVFHSSPFEIFCH